VKTSLIKAAVCASALLLQSAAAQVTGPAEYEVKAAFVHNIARFVAWHPEFRPENVLRFCIMGEDPFGPAIDVLKGKPIDDMSWEIAQLRPGAEVLGCHVLFIAASERSSLRRILAGAADFGILTVGDSEGYAAQGVMVNFFLERNKVRFEINDDAVHRGGLDISSQLLKLARIVKDDGGGR
jgi:hypothetical protein